MKVKKIQKPKHVVRWLKKKVEEECKTMTYYALEKFYTPQWNEEAKEYKTGLIVEYPVNTKRRVKKAFKKFGIHGALAYIQVFKKDKI